MQQSQPLPPPPPLTRRSPMEGYEKLAARMGGDPELGIFRRFAPLNTQNLLYLQAEVIHLECELRILAEEDKDSGHPARINYNRDWRHLSQTPANGNDEDKTWQKVLELRKVLREYNESLQHRVFLSQLPSPDKYNLEMLREWLIKPKMGNFPLWGEDQHVWDQAGDKANENDLITVYTRPGGDPFSRWVNVKFVPVFHWVLGNRLKKTVPGDLEVGLSRYSDSALEAFVDSIGTAISSLFPVASIAVLYVVHSMPARLGIVAGFTTLFSFCLALGTKARRVEVFAATAAFAAVMVVFVGSTSTNTTPTTNMTITTNRTTQS